MPSVFIGAYNKAIVSDLQSKVQHAWDKPKYPPSIQQQAVIDYMKHGKGHCIVQARAGSGKSTSIIMLLPHIAAHPLDIEVQTMHACGLRAWKQANPGVRIQVDGDKYWKVLEELATTENDSNYIKYRPFLKKLVSLAMLSGFGVEGGPDLEDVSHWEYLIELYDLNLDILDTGSKNGSGNTEAVRALIGMARTTYLASLAKCREGLISFDEMLTAPLYYRARLNQYKQVLIDEAQDLSFVRRKLALDMCKEGRVTAVGDSFQAIYAFSGADCNSIDLLRQALSVTGKEVVELPLTVTYRCPKEIVKLANTWVPDLEATATAKPGEIKQVWLSPQEGKPGFWDCGPFTANDAILCRLNGPLVSLAYDFLRKRIPAYVEGREIGTGLIKLAQKWKLKTLTQLTTRLDEWRDREVARLLGKGMESKAQETDDKTETMFVLIQATRDLGKHNISDMVDIINRMFADTPEGERPRCVTLSSYHKAKGRQWPRVFLLGFGQYCPSKWAKKPDQIQQEQNCRYVAVTRTMETLVTIAVPVNKEKR